LALDGRVVTKSGIIFIEARVRDDVDLGMQEAEVYADIPLR
jgi:hypothetical protein